MKLKLAHFKDLTGIAQKGVFHSSGLFLTLWLFKNIDTRVYAEYLILIAIVDFISPILRLAIPTVLLKDKSQTEISVLIGEWNYFYLLLSILGVIIFSLLIFTGVLNATSWFILFALITKNYNSLLFNLLRKTYSLDKILYLETFTTNVVMFLILLASEEKSLWIVLRSYLTGIILTMAMILFYSNKKYLLNFQAPKINFLSRERLSITAFNLLQNGPRQILFISFSYFRIIDFLPALKVALSINNLVKIPNVYFVTKNTPRISEIHGRDLEDFYFKSNQKSFAYTYLSFTGIYAALIISPLRNILGIDLSIILLSATISIHAIIEAKFSLNSTFLLMKQMEERLLKNFWLSNLAGLLLYFLTFLVFDSYQISIALFFIVNSLLLNVMNNRHINFNL